MKFRNCITSMMMLAAVMAVHADVDPDEFDDEIFDLEETPAEFTLRGSEHDNEEERDLASYADQKAYSFSVYSTVSADDCCFDLNMFCDEYISMHTYTNAIGSYARSCEWLALRTQCFTLSRVMAKSVASIHAHGHVSASIEQDNTGLNKINVKVALKQASMAMAIANSKATAAAYVQAEAGAYTEISQHCQGAGKNTLLCNGGDAKVKAIAVAGAGSFADAQGVSAAASGSAQNVMLRIEGNDIQEVSISVVVFAFSWAFAEARASATALAGAYTKVENRAFNKMCIKTFKKQCAKKGRVDEPACKKPPKESCAIALAEANASGHSFAKAFAAAFSKSIAAAQTYVGFQGSLSSGGTQFAMGSETSGGAYAVVHSTCPQRRYVDDQ